MATGSGILKESSSSFISMTHNFFPQCKEILAQLGGDIYCIPRRTAFFLNPPQKTDDILYHLTGFTGSSAYLLITQDEFFLYVDSRYTLQAQQQCPECTVITCNHPLQELKNQFHTGTRLVLSPWTHSAGEISRYIEAARIHGWTIILDKNQTIDSLIKRDPVVSNSPIYSILNTVSFQEKCQSVFTQTNQNYWLICSSSDIAWLTNLRGSDHDYAPFFDGYLLIQKDSGHFSGILYTSMPRSMDGLDAHIQVHDFKALNLGINQHSEIGQTENPLDNIIVYDAKKTPHGLVRDHWVCDPLDQIQIDKSIKNPWEIDHITQAHIHDGVALTQFLHWLSELDDTNTETEWSASEKLQNFRIQNPTYRGPSFPTISAMGENSAMMHYTPSYGHSALLASGIYLVDSGGQYCFGTTDVTRTVWLGKKDPCMTWKQKYTAVLQGHIHLSNMIFPQGTNGIQLDAVARSFLWQKGWDYAHSTGHGVGCFGAVHEFPPAISARASVQPIQENMVFSVEPGYYEPGLGGIRLENLVRVRDKKQRTNQNSSRKDMDSLLYLDTLTLAPFDRRLIDACALSFDHKLWLNQYHQQVYATLAPKLPEKTREWLKQETSRL